MLWDVKKDELFLKLGRGPDMSTKLSMIANVASVYVPLRLESPIELVGSLRSVARRVQSVFPAKL